MRFAPALLLCLIGCANPERELAQCKVVVGQTTGELASCLVRLHDWDSTSAVRAELHYDVGIRSDQYALQAQLDSADAMRHSMSRIRNRKYALEYCRHLGIAPADCDTTSLMDAIR